jgi:hypothetical protein
MANVILDRGIWIPYTLFATFEGSSIQRDDDISQYRLMLLKRSGIILRESSHEYNSLVMLGRIKGYVKGDHILYQTSEDGLSGRDLEVRKLMEVTEDNLALFGGTVISRQRVKWDKNGQMCILKDPQTTPPHGLRQEMTLVNVTEPPVAAPSEGFSNRAAHSTASSPPSDPFRDSRNSNSAEATLVADKRANKKSLETPCHQDARGGGSILGSESPGEHL